MDEMFEFRKNALSGALTKPLCDEYRHEWQKYKGDKESLIRFCLRQQSIPYFAHHCFYGKGLSKEYIKREFKNYINGYVVHNADDVEGYTYGLFVDYDYDNDLIIENDVSHIMWGNRVYISIPYTKCPIIYVSNNSTINLSCDGYNNVKIYLFDDSIVNVNDIDKESTITIYKYSETCVVNIGRFCFGKVKEFRKELRL
jgi:hypothetical protein